MQNFDARQLLPLKQPKSFQSMAIFIRALIANPRAMGAACPSSSYLANTVAAMLGKIDCAGTVVELGGGTGAITRAILQQGVDPERLITFERSPALADHLRQRFPGVRVVEGDARNLQKLLGKDAGNVRAVVSGLPLRSLPDSVVQAILHQVQLLLHADGMFVQFTYDLRTPSIEKRQYHNHVDRKIVWKNIPPARVDAFSMRSIT